MHMRILCIDYGAKRTGIAVTDPLKIIELMLVGAPVNLDDSETHATSLVVQFIKRLQKEIPQIAIQTIDERYTSKMAVRAMVDMGMKKKDRRKKENIDQIAATIMLQEYLNTI